MFDARSLCYLDPEAHQVPCKPRAITSRSSFAAVGLQNNLFCSVRSLGEEENLLPVRNGTTSISTCLDERPTTTVAGTNSALDPAAATNPLSRGVWCRTRGCFSDDRKNKQKRSSRGTSTLKRVEALRTARRANNQPKPKEAAQTNKVFNEQMRLVNLSNLTVERGPRDERKQRNNNASKGVARNDNKPNEI